MHVFLCFILFFVVPSPAPFLPPPSPPQDTVVSYVGSGSDASLGDGAKATNPDVSITSPDSIVYSALYRVLFFSQVTTKSIRAIRLDTGLILTIFSQQATPVRGLAAQRDGLYVVRGTYVSVIPWTNIYTIAITTTLWTGSNKTAGNISNVVSQAARYTSLQSIQFTNVAYLTDTGANTIRMVWPLSLMTSTIAVMSSHSMVRMPRTLLGVVSSPSENVLKVLDLLTGNVWFRTNPGQLIAPTFLFTPLIPYLPVTPTLFISTSYGVFMWKLFSIYSSEWSPLLNLSSNLSSSSVAISKPTGLYLFSENTLLICDGGVTPRIVAMGIPPVPLLYNRTETRTPTHSHSPSFTASMAEPSIEVSDAKVNPRQGTKTKFTLDGGRDSLTIDRLISKEFDTQTMSGVLRSKSQDLTADVKSLSISKRRRTTTEPTLTSMTPRETTSWEITPPQSYVSFIEPRLINGDFLADPEVLPRPVLTLRLTANTWSSYTPDLVSVLSQIYCETTGNWKNVNASKCPFDMLRKDLLQISDVVLGNKQQDLIIELGGNEDFSSNVDIVMVLGQPLQKFTVQQLEPIPKVNSFIITKTLPLSDNTRNVVLITSSVIVSLSFLSPSAFFTIQLFSLSGRMPCLQPASRKMSLITMWSLSPVYYLVGSYKGVPASISQMLWNMICLGAVVMLNGFALVIMHFVKKMTWEESAIAVQFPNVSLTATLFFVAGTVPAAFQSFGVAIYQLYRLVSMFSLIVIPVFLSGYGYFFSYVQKNDLLWQLYKDENNEVHEDGHQGSMVNMLVYPRGAWFPSNRAKTHGILFASFVPERRYFFSLDVVVISGLSFATGLIPTSPAECHAQILGVSGIMGIWGMAYLVMQPFRSRLRNVLRGVMLLLQASVGIMDLLNVPLYHMYTVLISVSFVDLACVIFLFVWEKKHETDLVFSQNTRIEDHKDQRADDLSSVNSGEELTERWMSASMTLPSSAPASPLTPMGRVNPVKAMFDGQQTSDHIINTPLTGEVATDLHKKLNARPDVDTMMRTTLDSPRNLKPQPVQGNAPRRGASSGGGIGNAMSPRKGFRVSADL